MSKDCWISGPNYSDGILDWQCRTHEVEAELIDPSKYGSTVFRRSDFYCPVEDGPETDLCHCILNEDPQWIGHTNSEHDAEGCKAGWTMCGPPCGGCINCIAAQMAYYMWKDLNKETE